MDRAGNTRASRWLGRRVLWRWRGVVVPSYVAMLYLGCVAGALSGAAVAAAIGMTPWRYALAALLLLIPALAGARIWYVLQHWQLYRGDAARLLRRADGGAGLFGGLVLAVAVSPLVLAVLGLPFLSFWDASAINMLVGLAVTRIGCLMNGCCCGRASTAWFAPSLPDHRGVWQRRVPTPVIEALAALLIVSVLITLPAWRLAPGLTIAAAAAAYGALRYVLEATRESFVLQPQMRTDRRFSLALCVAGLLGLWLLLGAPVTPITSVTPVTL